ncbi:MAG TPA: hypothetical protein VGI39_34405 [Polyangiaceae bacterium]|jgi:hypothetical protein
MPLQAWLVHASRLARALDDSLAETPTSDPLFVWLTGRAEEVRVFVREVLHDYLSCRVDAEATGEIIASYLEELHTALSTWYGEDFVPACCRISHRTRIHSSRPPSMGDTDAVDAAREAPTRETPSMRPPMQSEASYSSG